MKNDLAPHQHGYLWDKGGIGMAMIDPNGMMVDFNFQFTRMLEYSREELMNSSFLEIAHPDDKPKSQEFIQKTFASKDINEASIEKRFITRSGHVIWVDVKFVEMVIGEEEEPLLVGILKNITEKKKALELLEETQDMAVIGSWELELDNNALFWTDQVYRIHERPIDKPISFDDAVSYYPEPHYTRIRRAIERCINQQIPYNIDLKIQTDQGNEKWARAMGKPILEAGKVTKIRGTFQDVSERYELDEQLKNAVVDTQESERKYIGKELHDDIGQLLLGSIMQVESLEGELLKESLETHQNVLEYLNRAVQKVRNLSHGLMSNMLEDKGFAPAVKELLHILETSEGYTCEFKEDSSEKLDKKAYITLFRITQEALSNIQKYADAKKIQVMLYPTEDRDKVIYEIRDDGKGFDPSQVSNDGIGIQNMGSRAKLIDGKVQIDSAPGKGTAIKVEVPIQ